MRKLIGQLTMDSIGPFLVWAALMGLSHAVLSLLPVKDIAAEHLHDLPVRGIGDVPPAGRQCFASSPEHIYLSNERFEVKVIQFYKEFLL